MASIDERVVAMSFENSTFEAKVGQTMATLTKLNHTLATVGSTSGLDKIEASANKVTLTAPMSALDKLKSKLGLVGSHTQGFTDIEKASSKISLLNPMTALDKLRQKLGHVGEGAQGFAEIEKASNKVSLAGMGRAVDAMKVKFGALQTVGVAAIGTIVSKLTSSAGQLAKALTVGPLVGGLQEYATNLNSIQTILANTKASGAGLKDVNNALNILNKYSDQTIYNFSQMAKNIGTFTAAGVDLKTATQSIKGIANLAALSGSNSEQASTAMYQLSQAISAGRVSLQDWNSVVNAGMGGTVFQRALAQTAESMGTLSKGAVGLHGKMKNVTISGQSFRESITAKPGEKSWLTSDVLTNTLKQFTGDMSAAELKAQGFNDQQIKAIQATAVTAKKAATEVKTLSGVWDVAKESMGSGWAATWQLIFGNFGEAKKTFTGLSQAISNIIGNSAKARNAVLKDWKDLGGRSVLIEGIKNIFEGLGKILGTVKQAFRDIFPAKTGKDLFALTVAFRDLTAHLKASPQTLENLRKTFAGLFAILSIGWYVVKKIAGVIFDLLGIVGKGSGGFLNFTGGIGVFLTSLQKAIVKGDALGGVFKSITNILRVPLEIIKAIASAFFSLFSGMDTKKADAAGKSIDGVSSSLKPMKRILDGVVQAWKQFTGFLDHLKATPVFQVISAQFAKVGDAIRNAFSGGNLDKTLAALQAGLTGGVFLAIKKAISGGVDLTGGTFKNLNDVLKGLTGNLMAMQKNLQAHTLFLIAAAIAALAGGIFVLSTIDPKRLATAMTAVTVGMAQLLGAMAILSKFSSGFLSMPFIAASLIGLSIAVTILAAAMKIFATMSWGELAKGLVGVAGALIAVAAGVKLMGPEVLAVGPGLIAVAIAMNILAVAMKIFAGFSWGEIVKGIVGIAGSLLALGLGLKAVGPEMIIIGPGLILVALGMTLLAGAVSAFGAMKLGTLAKGILGAAAALVVIGLAINAIPPTVALQAAGLVILAVALTGIAGAIAMMGKMDVGTAVKGLITLGAALVILAVGLAAMSSTFVGSLALLAAAAALAILAPTLAFLGTLQWETILKGLAAMALTLGVLAVVGLIASTGLTALGTALLVVGAAVVLIGAGVYLLAQSFVLLGTEGTKGIGIMVAALTAFIALLPRIIIDFIKGLAEILAQVAVIAPKVVASMGKIIDSLLQIVIEAAPKLALAISALIQAWLKVVNDNAGPIIAAGFRLLQNFLSGIANNIGQVTSKVADIIVRFLTSLTAHIPELISAGVRTLVAWLTGITNHMPQVAVAVAKAITVFLNSVAANIGRVIAAGSNLAVQFVLAIGAHLTRMATTAITAIIGFLHGIANQIPKVISAAVSLAGKFVHGIATGLVRLASVGADAVIDFLNGMARVIRQKGPEIRAAGWNLASALIHGFLGGIADLWNKVKQKLSDLGNAIPGPIKKALSILSPSRVFWDIGKQTMLGLAIGIDDNVSSVDASMVSAAKTIINGAQSRFSNVPNLLDGLLVTEPVITPVLDLSNVERDAAKLADMTNVVPITAAASFDQASAISQQQQAVDPATAPVEQLAPVISLEQNNYSPQALSEIEIYRQTNNQLSQLKSAVGLTK